MKNISTSLKNVLRILMLNLLKKNQTENYQERTIKKISLEFSVDMMILSAWRDGIINNKKLSTYDRYLLEFIYLGVETESPSGLSTNIVIYNQDLSLIHI